MEIDQKALPDYAFWSKLETWTLKNAALLLHAFDPLEYRQVKFNLREIPNAPELKDVYKTFLILENVIANKQPYYANNSGIPLNIIYAVVEQKELSIPKQLKLMLDKRFQREEAEKQAIKAKHPFNKEVFTRERRNFLKYIGLLSHGLMNWKHPRYEFRLSDRPNAYNINQFVLDMAEKLKVNKDGLKSGNRKVTEALELLEEEME